MTEFNWADATRPRQTPKGNGTDRDGSLVELTSDVLQLIIDLIREYERNTGREITAPELADKLEHPGS